MHNVYVILNDADLQIPRKFSNFLQKVLIWYNRKPLIFNIHISGVLFQLTYLTPSLLQFFFEEFTVNAALLIVSPNSRKLTTEGLNIKFEFFETVTQELYRSLKTSDFRPNITV
ncbi:hypothetical protein HPB49_026577 [Dermacentor silvarum]|nr:hypothetical protein HPB49_026577 [Dermacentor silvarum]